MTALLEVSGLSVSYTLDDVTRPAVRDVSFTVDRGEVVAIVGESGSGKSTTAHAIIHLLAGNASVDAGAIRFDGADLTALSPRAWRDVRGRRIGLIPQDPTTSLNPVKRVGRQVAEPLVIHGLATRRGADAQAVELLRLAGIGEPEARARQFPHQFSGGMKQRALIADRACGRAAARDRGRTDQRTRCDGAEADPRPHRHAGDARSAPRCCSSRTTSASPPTEPTASS